jgi:hypothetical protein
MPNESLRSALDTLLITHGEISVGDTMFIGDGSLVRLASFRKLRDDFALLMFLNVGKRNIETIVDHPDLHQVD